MNTESVEKHLEKYVGDGLLMHLVTINEDGSPWMSPVWFASQFSPDRLIFTSRNTRIHSKNIHSRPHVTGSIVNSLPAELGMPVRGVMFNGQAKEIDASQVGELLAVFSSKFARATNFVSEKECLEKSGNGRLYQVEIDSWRLHDEINYPSSPRHAIPGRK